MANTKSAKPKGKPFYSDANVKELEKRYAEYKQHKTRSFEETKIRKA